jgi:hypothetical protein
MAFTATLQPDVLHSAPLDSGEASRRHHFEGDVAGIPRGQAARISAYIGNTIQMHAEGTVFPSSVSSAVTASASKFHEEPQVLQ